MAARHEVREAAPGQIHHHAGEAVPDEGVADAHHVRVTHARGDLGLPGGGVGSPCDGVEHLDGDVGRVALARASVLRGPDDACAAGAQEAREDVASVLQGVADLDHRSTLSRAGTGSVGRADLRGRGLVAGASDEAVRSVLRASFDVAYARAVDIAGPFENVNDAACGVARYLAPDHGILTVATVARGAKVSLVRNGVPVASSYVFGQEGVVAPVRRGDRLLVYVDGAAARSFLQVHVTPVRFTVPPLSLQDVVTVRVGEATTQTLRPGDERHFLLNTEAGSPSVLLAQLEAEAEFGDVRFGSTMRWSANAADAALAGSDGTAEVLEGSGMGGPLFLQAQTWSGDAEKVVAFKVIKLN